MSDESSTPPALTIGSINFAATDPSALAAFWIGVMGGEIAGETPDYIYVAAPSGGVPMFFHRVDTLPNAQGRIHLDLSTAPGRREDEVHRILALGATREWDVLDEVPWVEWTTMSDPEGNQFCVSCPR
jgi:Glyoxalase-like domain